MPIKPEEGHVMKFSPLYPQLFLGDGGEVYRHGIVRLTAHLCGKYLAVRYKRRNYYVHRIVASIHCTGYAPGMHVDHVDGNKLNNDPANLAWVTQKENNSRARATGLHTAYGESHVSAKLREADIGEIRRRFADGETQLKIAESYGIKHQHVSQIIRGTRWKHLPPTGAQRPPVPRVMTPEILHSALVMVASGTSITKAAKELGINGGTLSRALRVQKAKHAQTK